MDDQTPLSAEARELLKRMSHHTTESIKCLHCHIEAISTEQTAQRKLLDRTHEDVTALLERVKAHEKRLDKCETSESRMSRKLYTLAGAQTAITAVFAFIKGH